MNIKEQLNCLYQRYEIESEQLVKGGLINEDIYLASKIKIVSLMKEPNDPPKDGKEIKNWSLPEDLKKNIDNEHFKGRQMWKVLGTWIYAMQNQFGYYIDIYNNSNASEGLKYLGVTNLKKSGGGANSNNNIIREYAERSKELWTDELKIMAPDIVMCAGTYGIISKIIDLSDNKCLKSGVRYGSSPELPKMLFVDFYHPGYRVRPYMMYAYLKEAFKELHKISKTWQYKYDLDLLKFV